MNKYDVVEETTIISFFWLQTYRFLAFLVNISLTFIYLYIYMKNCFGYINFLASFLTTLAFGTLFTGSGKQVVYHKMVNKGIKDTKKTKLWIYGVFFYSQAIPFVITSNFMYYVNFRFLGRDYRHNPITWDLDNVTRHTRWYCKK